MEEKGNRCTRSYEGTSGFEHISYGIKNKGGGEGERERRNEKKELFSV